MRVSEGWTSLGCSAGKLLTSVAALSAVYVILTSSPSSVQHLRKAQRLESNVPFNQCLAGLNLHKELLRKEGYDIPRDGQHLMNQDMEGGSTEQAFRHLVSVADEAHGGNVCQTGMNYGTSAFAFLCAGAPAHVYSFDLGEHAYVPSTDRMLQTAFPGRHHLTIGDSTQTLPDVVSKGSLQCDFVFVDGGHSYEVAKADLTNFIKITKPGSLVLVDDCYQEDAPGLLDFQLDVGRAFREALADGSLLPEPSRARAMDDSRSICAGRVPTSVRT